MLARRFALAFGLLLAAVLSQVPEFVQQYRQRLGGALDEVRRAVAEFDAEAGAQSLDRATGIARLRANADPLAQARGRDVEVAAEREARLAAQEKAFAESGPLSVYAVFAERFDPTLAGRTYAIFQPAVPATRSGFLAGACGFLLGYGGTRAAVAPFRRRRRGLAAA